MPKTCSRCGLEKPLRDFYRQAGARRDVGAAVRLATRNSSERVMPETQRFKRVGVKSPTAGVRKG
jgi:hypothetical protein